MLFWHCSFSRGRCVVTLFGKCLCFACQCANQVLGNRDTKDLLIASVLFSKSSVPAARTNTLLVYKSPFCNRICEAQNNFPWDIFWIFFSCIISEGEKCQRVCVLGCVWVSDWMHVLFIPSCSDWRYCGTQQARLRWICATVEVLWCFTPNPLSHLAAPSLKLLCSLVFRAVKLFADLPATLQQTKF